MTYKIVIAFDSLVDFSSKQIEEILNICNNNKIYMINISSKEINLNNENIQIINFYKEIKENKNYLMVDKIHLTEEGNKRLSDILNDIINKL